MTLLNYLRSNREAIYFNTIKFDDYFINIVPFMLGNKVVKYDYEKIYDNKGDLFITDNTLLVEKAKKENFSILLIGESFKEGVEISKNIRLISTLKPEEYEDEELDIFEPFNLSLKISGFEKAKIFNLDNFVGEEKKFVPTMPPPPPPALKKVEQHSAPSSGQEKKFVPTMPPPPPPALKKVEQPSAPSSGQEKNFVPTMPPPPPPALRNVQKTEEKKFIPTVAPPPPPPLRSVQKEQKVVEKPKSRFPFVPFVKGGESEFKHANMYDKDDK
jgi:hypothetical protein